MRMTWVPVPTPDEVAFEAIKAGVDTLPAGAKMILNTGMTQMNDLTLSWRYISGEFYAMDGSAAGIDLLARFYDKYPDYEHKTFLSVKVRRFTSRDILIILTIFQGRVGASCVI